MFPLMRRYQQYVTYVLFPSLSALTFGEGVFTVRTQEHRPGVDKFQVFLGDRAWQGLCRDLYPRGFEYQVITTM